MRAAWGALKGAVQELNDALLEDEDDEYIKYKKEKNLDLDFQNECDIEDKVLNVRDNLKPIRRNHKTSLHFDNEDNSKISFSKNKSNYLLTSIDLINQKEKNKFDNLQQKKVDSKFLNKSKYEDKSDYILHDNKVTSGSNIPDLMNENNESQFNYEDFDGNSKTFELNTQVNDNELTNNCTRNELLNKENECCEDYCEDNLDYTEDLNIDQQRISLCCSEDDKTESNETNTLENDEIYYEEDIRILNESISQNTENQNFDTLQLPKKYVLELEKIFHIEISDVVNLCEIIQGYYLDWKNIRDTLIKDKDLILKIAPSHYEAYLKNNVLNEKSFSLGFTVLIGQCITSFLAEIKKKTNLVKEQDLYIEELKKQNYELNDNIQRLQIENSKLLKNISELEDIIISLKEENNNIEIRLENESNQKNEISLKRLESIENERNQLIDQINQLITERENNKIEIEKLHDHIGNLTSIIEGYQTEEDQINARYEIELEKARSQERKLLSKLSAFDSSQEELNKLKLNIQKLEQERNSLEKQLKEFQENNKNLFESNEVITNQLMAIKDEQKEYMIDKRFILQLIKKHNEQGSSLKYRNELFTLLCDAIGISEEDRSELITCQIRSNSNKDIIVPYSSQNMGFADLFYNFLNSEVEDNPQNN